MRVRLILEKGEGSPQVLELDPAVANTLGRSRKNTIVLRDEHASREHAQILCHQDQWFLENFNKNLNGTLVNGEKITGRRQLIHGDIIGIAELRLRFHQGDADPFKQETGSEDSQSPGTIFLTDELTCLYEYMTGSVQETDPQPLLERTLETVVKQTGASLVGFLNLDPDHPISKMIVPKSAELNQSLSRQLTERVKKSGQTVWMQGGTQENSTESLAVFSDAMCIPLTAPLTSGGEKQERDKEPLGALHVYRDRRPFTAREVQFCEVVAGFAASSLGRLRLVRILTAENKRLKGASSVADQLIGNSLAMMALRKKIAQAGASNATVLIEGESGVGKELVANALHLASPRHNGPFVVAHCGAFTESLLESQLFGYRKGAFTGALEDHPGYFQQADDGTLFLDEIGDMPLEGQVRFLRIIEGMPFRQVGGTVDMRTDVRIVAATNKDLEKAVAAKEFRPDLFFRLRVVFIRVPPLREHAEDIPAIVAHFLKKFAPRGASAKGVSEAAMRRLQEYHWPGNVRQLRGVLENAVVMGEGPRIEPADLGFLNLGVSNQPASLKLEDLEAWAIRRAMEQTESNLTQAAQVLGIGRDTLRKKIHEFEREKKGG